MRRLLACLLLLSPQLVHAAEPEDLRPTAQIALLPVSDHDDPALASFVNALWGRYFQTDDPQAFGRAALRLGRMDLNGDGQAELLILVDAPDWETGAGYPLVVANWTRDGWNPIGWSWGDEDRVFVVDEAVDGWHSLSTGTQLLRWDHGVYAVTDLPRP